MENLYCIVGIVEASKSFSREEGAPEKLENDLRENHISETKTLVTESSLIQVLSMRVASHCVMNVFNSIVVKYKELGYQYGENCLRCATNCHDSVINFNGNLDYKSRFFQKQKMVGKNHHFM